jgi:hypothetical protein
VSERKPKYKEGDLLETQAAPTLVLRVNPFCPITGWSYDVLKAGEVYDKVSQGNIDYSINAAGRRKKYWYDEV